MPDTLLQKMIFGIGHLVYLFTIAFLWALRKFLVSG